MKDSERAAFLVAFQEVLKPLMRIGRHYGLSGHDLWDSFAQSSVEFEAERINRTEQRSASPARVAMFTGLNKNEVVSRLAQQGLAAKNYTRRAQVLSEILNAWHTQQGYAAVYDLAREIPFDDERGPGGLDLHAPPLARDWPHRGAPGPLSDLAAWRALQHQIDAPLQTHQSMMPQPSCCLDHSCTIG